MDKVKLGRSELEVSPIAFGTWQLGGDWGATDEQAAIAAMGRAADLGINFVDTAQAYGFGALETLQPVYHLFRRDIEQSVLPYTKAENVGVLVYGPLAHGLLSGALTPESHFAADDWRSKSDVFRGEAYLRNLRIVSALERFAKLELGTSVSRLAVAWVLANPTVHVAIVGTRNPKHIEDAIAAADIK